LHKRKQLSKIRANTSTPTLAQVLTQARTLGLERIDAQMLLLHVLGRPDAGRAWLLAHDTDALEPTQCKRSSWPCASAAWRGEPVAYLTGRKEFYGLPLQVDARVLDPRPDTETLVDWALEDPGPRCPRRACVDLGTGSGAIALALQHQRPQPRCWPWMPAPTPWPWPRPMHSGWVARAVCTRPLAARGGRPV
jgi:release factor glutamine methyltransferase